MNYDEIGITYTATRKADLRIGQALAKRLNLLANSHLIDVGAGTGNYSHFLAELGFSVTAIEPSEVMRVQGKQHARLHWIGAQGESLPFPDGHFDGAVMTLSLHHVTEWQICIKEALRVIGNGPLVIFAFDPLHNPDFWLFDYFPTLAELDAGFKPSFKELQDFCWSKGFSFSHEKFPLPPDLCDHFAAAGWAQPSIYLDEKFRNGISTFSRLTKDELNEGHGKLQDDLDNGQWHVKYGHLLKQESHHRGYGFLRIQA